MATKKHNLQTFTFTVNGETMSFYCETTHTRSGFCHHAYFWGLGRYGEHTRQSYLNRTWERFDYETTLLKAIDKLPKKWREPLRLEVKAWGDRESEKCEKWLAAFTANYNALSSEQKQFLQDHTPAIETKDQADSVAATVALMAAIA